MEVLLYMGIFFGLYFAVFVFSTFFENKTEIFRSPKKKMFSSVCLIVPGYNEESNIEKTLNSLVKLDYPQEKLEIKVVDDGSEDQTFLKAREFEKKYPNVKVYKKQNGGKYTALNFALGKTKAEFVGSVDADSFLDAQALKKIMAHFENSKTMAVISTVKIAEAKNIIEKIQCVEFLAAAFLRKIFAVLDSINVTPGPLSVFKREVFETLGPYRKAHQTEDLEIAFRLQKANFKIAHAVDAIVYTKACPDLKSLFRQRLRWRRGFLLNLKDYPELLNFKNHGCLSFLLFYSLIGSFISITMAGYALWQLGAVFLDKINHLILVGFDFPDFSFHFDLFSLTLKPTLTLGILSLFVLVIYLLVSQKLTFGRKPLKKDVVSYLLFYNFLNAGWWLSAIYAVIFKKDINW